MKRTYYMTNLDFMVSIPLLRGAGVCFGCAIPDTPLPLSRGEYIKFNVVMYYSKIIILKAI